jgi:hypothetical protein
MARLESANPDLAVDFLLRAGNTFDAFDRILRLVETDKVSVIRLAGLANGLGQRQLRAEEVGRVLRAFTRGPATTSADAVRAAVQFLATYFLFEHRSAAGTCLASDEIRVMAWRIVENAVPSLSSHTGAMWTNIVMKLATCDQERAAKLFGEVLLSENLSLRDAAKRALTELAKTHPKAAMDGTGAALLDPERGWLLQITNLRDLVAALPADIVFSWVRKHGCNAAKAIARHLPLPHLDEHGNPVVPQILDSILGEYDEDDVFMSFCGGAHSGEGWWGNGADRFWSAAEVATKFLTHPNSRIREWAKHEIDYRSQVARWENQMDEERLLPS